MEMESELSDIRIRQNINMDIYIRIPTNVVVKWIHLNWFLLTFSLSDSIRIGNIRHYLYSTI
jgi:hypothetical protein